MKNVNEVFEMNLEVKKAGLHGMLPVRWQRLHIDELLIKERVLLWTSGERDSVHLNLNTILSLFFPEILVHAVCL